MNFLRFTLALLLWPGLAATLIYLGKILRSVTHHYGFPWAEGIALSGGFLVACVAFLPYHDQAEFMSWGMN